MFQAVHLALTVASAATVCSQGPPNYYGTPLLPCATEACETQDALIRVARRVPLGPAAAAAAVPKNLSLEGKGGGGGCAAESFESRRRAHTRLPPSSTSLAAHTATQPAQAHHPLSPSPRPASRHPLRRCGASWRARLRGRRPAQMHRRGLLRRHRVARPARAGSCSGGVRFE